MKLILSCLIASIFFFNVNQAMEPGAFSHSAQMVVVTTGSWDAPQGMLRRYERKRPGKPWQPVSQPITVMVGKSGLGWGTGLLSAPREASDPVKKEGDGKAPAGVFRLSKAFGYAPQEESGWKMPYVSLTPTIECVDDEKSKFYNTLVDTTTVSADWGSHENEKMRRADDLYRWGILVDHNANPTVAGRGSCIFMHIWRGPGQPTVGCTAMAQDDLESLLGWLDPKRMPLLVQLPAAQYQKLRHRWNLPKI
ncbi:MAG TPA: L,D-transpeptidase family protein, partial [Alphaproteobacteria bacterium]|nr:L,D-transpeptidase family protein [Alphaproteobacteria bacterium]